MYEFGKWTDWYPLHVNWDNIISKPNLDDTYLRFRGLTSNANWALKPGIYSTKVGTVDANGYGILLVLGNNIEYDGSSDFFQLWFQSDNGHILFRRSIDASGGGDWTE